jgi:hypothetical protein
MRQTQRLLLTSHYYFNRSLQVVVTPCCQLALPDVISVNLSLRARTPTPTAPVLLLLVSSHRTSAFPETPPGQRLAITILLATSVCKIFRRCSYSFIFKPVDLLATQVAPTVTGSSGSRGFYFPAYLSLLPPRAGDMLTA